MGNGESIMRVIPFEKISIYEAQIPFSKSVKTLGVEFKTVKRKSE